MAPCRAWQQFLLTHPVWDVTCILIIYLANFPDFYSHIPCGMWLFVQPTYKEIKNFYSHIPCGMWQGSFVLDPSARSFLLTHPVWDVTLWQVCCLAIGKISTHTSRVGCDLLQELKNLQKVIISTHTSRVGCDQEQHLPSIALSKFLLTHPVWDVTEEQYNELMDVNISTHTSRVGCDKWAIHRKQPLPISTHTSRVGCDCARCWQ